MYKNKVVIICFVCFSTILLSWSISGRYTRIASPDLTDESILANSKFDNSLLYKPVAEDVLVQKIKGDNQHLLLMAYYSKENFSGDATNIENAGEKLVLRDDGKGDDKLAGDGFYTVKISTDVNSFQQMALQLSAQQKINTKKSFHFQFRSLVYDADAPGYFDENKLNSYQPVSITSLNSVTDTIASVLKTNSLFITKLSVVEDSARTWNPCKQTGTLYGAWTFQKLIRELATVTPNHPPTDSELSGFVLQWLNNFSITQIINGDTVNARPLLAKVLTNPWLQKSADNGAPKGQLDMRFAPFKLLAIVNRFDQRGSFTSEPAGEARFVFTLLTSNCTDFKNYTFAIEYTINKPDNCDSLQSWANQWYHLKDLPLGSKSYNAALQKITDQFTLCGNNPNNTNQNCFKSLRSNDQALTSGLTPIVGEFREFVLSNTTHTLVLGPVTNAPADRFNTKADNSSTRLFADYVNTNTRNIVTNSVYSIPIIYKDSPFLGGKTRIIGGVPVGNLPGPFHWDGSEPKATGAYIKNNVARHVVSLNACSGCHAGETQTLFWHVDPTFYGKEAAISGFLTGKADPGGSVDFDNNSNNDSMVVKDPALRPVQNPQLYVYNDILRRAIDLQDFVNYSCGSVLKIRNQLMFQPLNMVH